MPCNGEFNPINFKSICYFKQDCCWTSNYIGAWKCFHYKPLKTYSKLNSVKKVFMVFLFTPAAGLYLQCLAYTHLCLFASCKPQTKWTLQLPSVWRNHNVKWRRGLRSFHAGLARPSMLCLGDKLPTWPWMPWTTALLLHYYNQVSSYIGLKFADAAHKTISIRLKVTPSKSSNWPSIDHEVNWTARFNGHWKNKPADVKAGSNRNPIQVEISAILALYNDARYS